jgi:ribonuclease P protein component
VTGGGASPGAGGGSALPKAARITGSNEIRTLFRRGKRRKTNHLDVFLSASPALRSRIGLVVPKLRQKTARGGRRVRGAAVQRNRLKRRLREISRRELLPAFEARGLRVDLLVRARPEAYEADFAALRDELVAVREWVCSSDS